MEIPIFKFALRSEFRSELDAIKFASKQREGF